MNMRLATGLGALLATAALATAPFAVASHGADDRPATTAAATATAAPPGTSGWPAPAPSRARPSSS